MNICIVDDHLLLAQLIGDLIAAGTTAHDIKTYQTAGSFLSEDFAVWKPDIVLVDLGLPDMNGLELVEKAIPKIDGAKFIVLSSVMDVNTVKRAMGKGVSGYLTKDIGEEELVKAINEVYAGRRYINQTLKDKMIDHEFDVQKTRADFGLSPREKEVLQKLCEGLAQKEIAGQMGLSINTTHHYIRNIMGKLKINRTTELILFAMQQGLYSPPVQL